MRPVLDLLTLERNGECRGQPHDGVTPATGLTLHEPVDADMYYMPQNVCQFTE